MNSRRGKSAVITCIKPSSSIIKRVKNNFIYSFSCGIKGFHWDVVLGRRVFVAF